MGFPISPALRGTDVTFRLVEFRPEAFLDPFYDTGAMVHRFHETGINRLSLDECPPPNGGIPLKAIIFHLSHCGSTLLSQLMSLKPGHRVVSEAELVNSVLLSHIFSGHDKQKTILRLQKALGLLLQPLHGNETAGFVKLTSWNLFHVPLIMEAFPGVPLWYVHRHPLEVVSSLSRDPQGFATWNQHGEPLLACRALGLSREEVKTMAGEDFIGAMVLKHMSCALDLLPRNTLFFYYPDWISSFPDQVHPEIIFSETERTQVRQRLGFDAKEGDIPFLSSKGPHKTLSLDPQLNTLLAATHAAVCEKWK